MVLRLKIIYLLCGGPELDPWVGKIPGGRHDHPLQEPCLGDPDGQRSLESHHPWCCKESDTTERLSTAQHIYNNI